MLKVIYCKDAGPVSDCKALEFVSEIWNTYVSTRPDVMEVQMASDLCLVLFGLWAEDQKISPGEIEFYFENEKMEFDSVFGLIEWLRREKPNAFYRAFNALSALENDLLC